MISGYDSNHYGRIAESRAWYVLTTVPSVPLNAQRLEEKWPIIDIYVQFTRNGKPYYFFIQVKHAITGLEGMAHKQKLGVILEKEDHMKLSAFDGPTYLFGVDLSGGELSNDKEPPKVYIRTIRSGAKSQISSIAATDKTELTEENLKKLIEEVMEYWDSNPRSKSTYKSNFDKR